MVFDDSVCDFKEVFHLKNALKEIKVKQSTKNEIKLHWKIIITIYLGHTDCSSGTSHDGDTHVSTRGGVHQTRVELIQLEMSQRRKKCTS